MLNSYSKIIKFLLLSILIEVLLFTVFRMGFVAYFYSDAESYSFNQLIYAFWVGFRFDLQLAIIILLPILFFAGFKYIGVFKSGFGKRFWLIYLLLVNLIIISLYATNIFHYEFFKRLVDSGVVRYLYDIKDAFTMLSEGYPIYKMLAGLIVFSFLAYKFFSKIHASVDARDEFFSNKKSKWLVYSLFTLAFIFTGYGKFEAYPWRWSEAFYSSDKFLSYVASNPVTYFQNTLKNKGEKYNIAATKETYEAIADYFEVKKKDKERLNFTRIITPNHAPEYQFSKPNIVFILGESTSYARTSLSNNPLNPTPFLKKMSESGLSYSRYYTPHAGTARGVWATITGLADVEHMRTSSRNPMVVNQQLVLNALKDYKKFYFIGGSLSWGNVRGVVSNLEGVTKLEEQAYVNSPHNDVWGISDAHLVGEVNDVLKKQNDPFFAYVQLAGNHSPNTIPEESFGFVKSQELGEKITQDNLLKYSFDGKIDELDGQRFLDHSVKRLIELAQKEAYFDNTIFIFVGDHGLNRRGDHLHKAEQVFETATLHTPLIIYAPKLLKHKRFDYPVSAVDMPATIAGLTGVEYINSTTGRDILDKNFDEKKHYSFYIQHGNNPLLSIIGKDYLYRIRADGSEKQLYQYYFEQENKNLVKSKPDLAKEMEALTRGIYESTRYIRYKNSPQEVQTLIKSLNLKTDSKPK